MERKTVWCCISFGSIDNTIESFASSLHIQISDIIKEYGGFFTDVHGPEGTNQMRPRTINCFESLRKCKSHELGFSTFSCPDCNTKKYLFFTCKRRICSSCSKPLCDKRINGVSKWLPTNISYIHITFTLPEELRDFWLRHRKDRVLPIIFEEAHNIIKDFFLKRFGCEPGIFSVMHTFGSYVNWNPHLHIVFTLGGADYEGEWISAKGKFISYKSFKNQWRARIIQKLRGFISSHYVQDFEYYNAIFKKIFKKHWYVQLSDPIFDISLVMGYITRYMYRPPVSLTKIIDIHLTDDAHTSTITLQYTHKKPKEERIITYTIFEFIGLIARQLPDKYFRTVRYSGIFTPQKRKKYLTIISIVPAEKGTPKPLKKRPTFFQERMISAFGKDPLKCSCGGDMKLESITFWSKQNTCFITKYFDSS